MRTIVITVTLAVLATAILAWHQYRNVHDECYSSMAQIERSRLTEARKVESMLRDGKIEDALAILQTSRDLRVLRLADIRSAIDMGSWRWSRDEKTLEKAESALREEAEYRQTNGDSNTKIADQVNQRLQEFRQ